MPAIRVEQMEEVLTIGQQQQPRKQLSNPRTRSIDGTRNTIMQASLSYRTFLFTRAASNWMGARVEITFDTRACR